MFRFCHLTTGDRVQFVGRGWFHSQFGTVTHLCGQEREDVGDNIYVVRFQNGKSIDCQRRELRLFVPADRVPGVTPGVSW